MRWIVVVRRVPAVALCLLSSTGCWFNDPELLGEPEPAAIDSLAAPRQREGLTALVTTGYGLQWYNSDGPKESAVSGLNLGIGGFASENVAVMLRSSGTYRNYEYTWYTDYGHWEESGYILCGTVGLDLQWWATKRLNFEFGAGLGVLSTSSGGMRGWGLLSGAGYTVWRRPDYGVQVGIEFAPYFRDSTVIRNLGFTLGFQCY